MARYSYLICDILTGRRIGRVPLEGVSFDRQMAHAGVGGFTGKLAISQVDPSAMDLEPLALNDPPRLSLYAYRDNVPVWSGIIWDTQYDYDSQGEALTINASEWWSWFQRRRIRSAVSWTNVDQMNVFRDHLRIALGQTCVHGKNSAGALYVPYLTAQTDIRLTWASTPTSGVMLTQAYNWWDGLEIGQQAETLAKSVTGFEFYTDAGLDANGLPRPILVHGYPRVGVPANKTIYRWKAGLNVESVKWHKRGGQFANSVAVYGSGQGSAMAQGLTDQVGSTPGYPVVELALSYKNSADTATLNALAKGAIRLASPELPEITVRADVDPILGTWNLGDHVLVQVESGMFPRSDRMGRDRRINAPYRVVAYRVQVGDDGTEIVTPTLNAAV